MFVLLPQLQQPLKQLHPLRFQLPGIHQLLVVLPPRAHVAFLRDELGGFAVVGFQKVNGFLPFGESEFVLGHCSGFNKIREAFAPRTVNFSTSSTPSCSPTTLEDTNDFGGDLIVYIVRHWETRIAVADQGDGNI